MGFNGWNRGSNKYGARKTSYQGLTFDSVVERDRFRYLQYQQQKGEISNLHLQWSFEVFPKITKIVPTQLKTKVRYDERVVEQNIGYKADFVYRENGRYVIEDTKSEYGMKGSRDYPLRRKLMVAIIQKHNAKGHGQWIFRESILKGSRLIIHDIEP